MKKVFRVEETTYLSTARFQWLFNNLISLGCFTQNWAQTLDSLKANKVLHRYLGSNERTKGTQTIFRYEKNGKIIIILTTYDAQTGTAKRVGSGWLLIIDPRSKRPFFWFPLRRTRYFMERMLKVVKLLIDIVTFWPKCPECGVDLQLIQVAGFMHMRKFTCLNKLINHAYEKPEFLITTMSLPEQQRIFLQSRFDEYYMYRSNDAEHGIYREYARIIRTQRNEQRDMLANPETVYHDLCYESKNGENMYYDDGAHIE